MSRTRRPRDGLAPTGKSCGSGAVPGELSISISPLYLPTSINIVLTGSKKMTPDQQEAAMTVGRVRILVADADDPENVLIDAQVPAKEFKTRSVGYGLQQRDLHFTRDR